MRTTNRLSEKIISALVPSERDTKHFDGAGLHIRVLPNGSRYWHLKFKRADGKESLKSLGKWPDVDCAAARAKAAVVRAEIAAGQAPTRDRRPETVGNHFNAVAETWLQSRHQWTDKHAHDVARRRSVNNDPLPRARFSNTLNGFSDSPKFTDAGRRAC